MRYTNVIKSILAFSIILFNVDLASAELQISQKEMKLEKNITSWKMTSESLMDVDVAMPPVPLSIWFLLF